MKEVRVAIVGTPRSGSSFFASTLESLGLKPLSLESPVRMSSSQFNKEGYFEDTYFNLLTDQLIRYSYGTEYSFLNPPSVLAPLFANAQNDWSFDLNESTLEVPDDYESNFDFYCGNTWDVWGLTRMVGDGKWNKIYSKLKMANTKDLLHSLENTLKAIESKNNIYVKDARLLFVLDYFKEVFTHVVFLTREEKSLTSSIQNHYGPRMFIGPTFDNFDWVSNHFNYKIPNITFNTFISRYELAAKFYSEIVSLKQVSLNLVDTKRKIYSLLKTIGILP